MSLPRTLPFGKSGLGLLHSLRIQMLPKFIQNQSYTEQCTYKVLEWCYKFPENYLPGFSYSRIVLELDNTLMALVY